MLSCRGRSRRRKTRLPGRSRKKEIKRLKSVRIRKDSENSCSWRSESSKSASRDTKRSSSEFSRSESRLNRLRNSKLNLRRSSASESLKLRPKDNGNSWPRGKEKLRLRELARLKLIVKDSSSSRDSVKLKPRPRDSVI